MDTLEPKFRERAQQLHDERGITRPATALLFLDVDGVLNSIGHGWQTGYYGRPPQRGRRPTLRRLNWDPACVARVRRIVARSGADIVISSSWRMDMGVEQFRQALALYGWKAAPVIDVTPVLGESLRFDQPARGHEVAAWLAQNAVEYRRPGFVCLDDVDDFLPGQPLVQTDAQAGIQDRDVGRVLALLRPSDGTH